MSNIAPEAGPRIQTTATKLFWPKQQSDFLQMVQIHQDCLPDENWTEDDLYAFAGANSRVPRPSRVNVIKMIEASWTERPATADDEHKVEIAGTLLYSTEGDVCRIRRICVLPAFRRRGIARMVLTDLVMPGSPVRKSRFIAHVNLLNSQAAKLFASTYGFSCKNEAGHPETVMFLDGRECWLFKATRRTLQEYQVGHMKPLKFE